MSLPLSITDNGSVMDFAFFPYLIFFALFGLIFWRGWDVKKHAAALAGRYCEQNDLQLLDQSVVLESIRPVRDNEGRLVFRRVYRFEFASTGDQRYQGSVVLSGMRAESVQLEPWRLQ